MNDSVSQPTEMRMRRWLARNVRRRRERMGLTLQDAAERGDIHWRHWQKIEAREVTATPRTLQRLAPLLAPSGHYPCHT
jgi:hypothetical protein